jgi:hypothetical protein
MQPIHSDELLGGTWQWERDDDEAHGDELEQLHGMLDDFVSVLAEA